MIHAPNLEFDWLVHGFGLRDSVPPADLTTAQQIHSARVLDACGRKGERLGEGDAIISSDAGVAIGVRTADCVPILIADSRTRTIACIHAGWRGTAANISGATIDALVSRGCQVADLHVAIGPSIGFCCYEVGPEVTSQLENWSPGKERVSVGRPTVDLPEVNRIQLMQSGVRSIWKSGECTYCRADRFCSYRREKEQAGRMLSFVNRVA